MVMYTGFSGSPLAKNAERKFFGLINETAAATVFGSQSGDDQ